MLVAEILNKDIAPLRLKDPVSLAITKMDLMRTHKFVVVNEDNKVQGMINMQTLIEVADEETRLEELLLDDLVFVRQSQHLFETTRQMFSHELYVLPVIDGENHLLGLVRKREVLNALGNMFNLSSFGSVITIDLDEMDYTLTEIVRIVETEEAKILGIAVQQPSGDQSLYRVSIKLNLQDSSVVSAALRRFGYIISSEERSESMEHNFSDRADELIRYLDI